MTKSLIISSAAILLLFIVSIIFSSICMNTVRELQSLTASLPSDLNDVDAPTLNKIDRLWSSRRLFLSLIMKKEYIVNIDVSLKTLLAYGQSDAQGDYHYARFAFLANLNAISEIESITLHSVF